MRKLGVSTLVAVAALMSAAVATCARADASAGGAPAPGKPAPPKFLTGASAGKPVDIALGYLRRERESLRLARGDLRDVVVSDVVVDRDTGTTHVYLRQRFDGIEVAGGVINVSVAEDGSIITLGNRFVPDLASRMRSSGSLGSAEQGVEAAAGAVGLTPTRELRRLRASGGPARETVFGGAGISARPIPAKLVYVRDEQGALRLAWNAMILERGRAHYWNVSTDASTGELIDKTDQIQHATPSYNVFAPPIEAPSFGARSIVTESADPLASPFGWHDTDGVAGPESTRTIGNNVHAALDLNANHLPDPDTEPDGGPTLAFDFPFDPNFVRDAGREYALFWPAAVTNIFHTSNVLHDVFYRHGFDEDAGNFQTNNYGRGGQGGDPVRALPETFAGNNAFFFTPPDGGAPEMSMGPFFGGTATLRVTSPIPADYKLRIDPTNGRSPTVAGVTGTVELVNDGVGETGDACESLVGFTAGNIALIRSRPDIDNRGPCFLGFVVQRAEAAGASAVLFVNAPNHGLFAGTIPVVHMTTAQGDALQASLPAIATLFRSGPDRHSAFDNGLVAHEYGHGVASRLVGGPSDNSCLFNEEVPGEGWSDFLALVMTARGDSALDRTRGFATYSLGEAPGGPGWRGAPYSTDLAVNPWTYGDLRQTPFLDFHYVGSRFAQALWEVYWNLVEQHGFNSNLYEDWSTGGNNLALRLLLDGLKLMACSPGFVDARNAMLLADQNLTGGQNQCLLWRGFAKRGLGENANQGNVNNPRDAIEDFTVPASACGPVASPNPAALSESVVVGGSRTRTLKIGNEALAGGDELHWTVSESSGACSSPADLPWVSVTPTGGTTARGGTTSVNVSLDASGLTPAQPYSGRLCLTSDDPGNATVSIPLSLRVEYAFSGFFGSMMAPPNLNAANAGGTAAMSFSLAGNFGLNVLAAGSPTSQRIDCTTKAALGASSATATPKGESLSYKPSTGRYTYPWKTDKSFGGTCRRFVLQLNDAGQPRAVYVKF